MSVIEKNTQLIKSFAAKQGFDYCGIAKAELLTEDAKRLESWLNKGMHGTMQYMENNFDMRIDPSRLVPGAKSVITLLFNYFPDELQIATAPKIAKYAFGNDYHEVIREKLTLFLAEIKLSVGEVNGRGGRFSMSNERMTILEAISMAGDISEFGRRDNIMVIREVNGERKIARINLLSKDIFKSPYYSDVLFNDFRMLPGIPNGDIQLNPNLVQNVGY